MLMICQKISSFGWPGRLLAINEHFLPIHLLSSIALLIYVFNWIALPIYLLNWIALSYRLSEQVWINCICKEWILRRMAISLRLTILSIIGILRTFWTWKKSIDFTNSLFIVWWITKSLPITGPGAWWSKKTYAKKEWYFW